MNSIDRLNKPQSTTGKLKYGRGDVTFETNGEVAAFEIDYIGVIKGIKKLGEGWTIKIGKNKIVIFSLAESELTELLFTYIGEMEITKCMFVNWEENKYFANIENLNRNKWNINFGEWGSDARKPEEIEDITTIKKQIKKSSI